MGLEDTTIERPAAGSSAATDLRPWLEQLAAERGAIAVIQILGDDGVSAIDVWVRKSPGRFEVTRVAVDPDTTNSSARLAIRALEALRASLLEVEFAARYQSGPRGARPPAPKLPAPVPPMKPVRERVGLEFGATVLVSPGGVGPAVLPSLRVDWAVRPRLLVQASLAAFGSNPSVTTASGSARVAREYFLLGGCYRLWGNQPWWPFLSIAAGALHTSAEGQAGLAMNTHVVDQWSLLTDAGLGATIRFYQSYHLTLSGHVQLAQPYVAIHFGDAVAATTGRPEFLLTLAVGAWL